MKKIMIFDMDGVIIDSEPIHESARQEMFLKYGIRPEEITINPIGKSCSGYWADVLKAQNIQGDPLALQDEQYSRTADIICQNQVPANPGMIEVLTWCKEQGIKVGLASSSTRVLVDRILEHLQIGSYFDATVSGDEVSRKKPDPEIYRKVLEMTGMAPEDAVAAEDSGSGIRAARAAGIYCCGYVNPTSGVQNLSEAEKVITSLLQLKEVLGA